MRLPPAGWRRVELEEVAEIQTGLAKGSVKFDDPIELPYLRVANVQDGYLDLTEVKTVQVERRRVDRYRLRHGDVLLTEGGDFDKLGRGAVWQGQVENCLHQNHVFVVRPDKDVLLPEFLSGQTSSPYGKQYFLACAKQTTNLASINSTQLKQFPVLLPPLPEQRKIAQILGTWDAAIGRVEQLIAALQRRKQGLMQRLLTGQVRFAEFAGQEWSDSPLAEFVVRSSAKFDPQRQTDELPCIELEHMSQETGQIIDTISVQGQQSTKNRFQAGQVLFGKLRPYLRKYAQPRFDGVCSSEIWVLTGKDHVCTNDYLFYLVQTHEFVSAANATSGTKMPRADWEHLSQQYFMLPPLDEQARIVEVFRICDEEISLHQQKLAALRRQKQGLMQRLLTGQVRVKGEETAAGDRQDPHPAVSPPVPPPSSM